MFRTTTLAILLVAAALVAPLSTANAAVQADKATASAPESDTVGRPILWGTSVAALQRAVWIANDNGWIAVGSVKYGYVAAAGGNAYWVYIVYVGY